MKIIAHKHNTYNTELFLNSVIKRDYVDGSYIDVALTKDGKIVLLSTSNNVYTDLQNIEQNTLNSIVGYTPLTLEDFLKLYPVPDKNIYINLLTSSVFMNYPKIQLYIQSLKETLDKFKDFTFTIVSNSQELVYYIYLEKMIHQTGLVIEDDNFNYLDVNTYVLTVPLLNDKIIKEQLNNNKEIMILLNSWDDLYTTVSHFVASIVNKTSTQEEIDKIALIGFYPRIIYQYIQSP